MIPDASTTIPSRTNRIVGSLNFVKTLLISIASKSVPPVAQPLKIAIPMAEPTSNPPAIPAINKLLVMCVCGINFRKTGAINVTYKVLSPKLFPRKSIPMISKGADIPKETYSTGRPIIAFATMDIPVIPPGASRCSLKNRLTAMAMSKLEIVIKK